MVSDGAANGFAIGSEVEVSDAKENRGGRGGGASEMRIYRGGRRAKSAKQTRWRGAPDTQAAFGQEHHIASKGNRR